MICPSCRESKHEQCPEAARQADLSLSPTERAGSLLCDCQHQAGFLATITRLNDQMLRSLAWAPLAHSIGGS